MNRSKAAQAMGRAKSEAKAKAARENGKKGGRPSQRYPTYDGEGAELGMYTLREAREQFSAATFERDSDTITVER